MPAMNFLALYGDRRLIEINFRLRPMRPRRAECDSSVSRRATA
jgi:hypothetical protein